MSSLLLVWLLMIEGCARGQHGEVFSPGAGPPARKFVYWLADIKVKELAQSDAAIAVMDYSADGSPERAFSPGQIASLRKTAGGTRTLLAYLSVGEAEDYRFYWNGWKAPLSVPPWSGTPPFLGPENNEWKGNYLVDYRSPAWKKVLFSYINTILNQGFDGLYLDKIDSYQTLAQEPLRIRGARMAMEKLVIEISRYAKARRSGFLIYVQNAEELVHQQESGALNVSYLDAIDGIGREETFLLGGKRREENERDRTLKLLLLFKAAGKEVLITEYPDCSRHDDMAWIEEKAAKYGFSLYCGPVELDRLLPRKSPK